MKELIYAEEEKEFLDYYKRLKELLKDTVPWNGEADRFQKDQINLLGQFRDHIHRFAKDAYELRNRKSTLEHSKWNTYHNVNCPECKSKLQLKPIGEIKLDDDLMYFQFYCKKCSMNFESDKPNNDDDLVTWYENKLKALNTVGPEGIKVYQFMKMKEGDFKELIRKGEYFKEKVNEGHLASQAQEKSYQAVMNNTTICLEKIKKMVDVHQEGVNVFGIRPKLRSELPYKYSKDEKELMGLLDYLKDLETHQQLNCIIDNEPLKLIFNRLEPIEEELKSYVNEIKISLQSEEVNLNFKWNNKQDISCTICKKTFKLIPLGEMKAPMNHIHFSYYCPDCNVLFVDQMPNNERDKIKFYENSINNHLTTKEDKEKALQLHGTTEEAIEMVKTQLLQLKENHEREMEYDKSMEEFKEEHKETVKKHVGELIVLKHQLMTGSSVVGES